jgi:DNA-binding IclR family transcriptional regulator
MPHSCSICLAKMKKAAPETPSIQSLDRGITILEAVAKSSHPVSIGQLRELLGINRSSVFRLANTLRRRGFLANPDGHNEFIIGPSIWRLFRNYDWSMLVSFCRHHLKTLAELSGETAHLGVRQNRQALFIDHQTSRFQAISVTGRTGEFMPLHSTAHGKALLADCSVEQLKAIVGAEALCSYTPRTISSVEELAEACAKIKIQGYALDEAEHVAEIRCVAAPIRDKEGAIVAAIGISAPEGRLTKGRLPTAIHYVTDAARKITEVLGA